MKKMLFLVVFFIASLCSVAQPIDTTVKHNIDTLRFEYFNVSEGFIDTVFSIDTALFPIQQYNVLDRAPLFYSYLGNIGTAADLKQLNNSPIIMGFDYGLHVFDNYLVSVANLPFYITHKSYTSLFYVMGAKKEQLFDILHTQNIAKRLNIALQYNIINSPGFYQRQKTDHSNVAVTSNYYSANERYRLMLGFYHNRLKIEENGGIQKDSIFDNNVETRRDGIAVNLKDASNRYKETGYFFKQSIGFKNHRLNRLRGMISYTAHYHVNSMVYEDNEINRDFYNHIYIDSLRTLDTISVEKFENTLTWMNDDLLKRTKKFIYLIQFKQQYIEVYNIQKKYSFINQYVPSFAFRWKLNKKLSFDFDASYAFSEHNDNDWMLYGKISKGFPLWGDYVMFSASERCQFDFPAVFYESYSSNNFEWEKVFSARKQYYSGLNVAYKTFQVGVDYNQLYNYIYLDEHVSPKQEGRWFDVAQVYLDKTFNVWNFSFKNRIVYQEVIGHAVSFISLPKWTLKQSLYYTFKMLGGELLAQPGLDFFYNTSYYANAYMPALQQFYLQRVKETGDYPYVDLFLNVQIKRARFFLKYQHINSGMSGYNYYQVPHYPMPDRSFKFGIAWRFND